MLLFDGVVGAEVHLEERQIRTVGPSAIKGKAGRPCAAQIGATCPISLLVVPGVVGADTMWGIRVRRDNWASVRYAEELNSGKSSVTLQSTDRHDILGQKSVGARDAKCAPDCPPDGLGQK